MINLLKRLLGGYDEDGLKYSINHLKNIMDEIPYYPIEKQAEYADGICVSLIDDKEHHDSEFDEINEGNVKEYQYFNLWNATSVGNTAYVALNSPYPDIREKAKLLLQEYKNWHKRQK